MSTLMFEPLTDESDINETLAGRAAKGEKETFLTGLENAYQAYIEENPEGHFIVPLNEREGAKFFGKATDSLYASLYSTLKTKNLTTVWRLVRVTKTDDEDNKQVFLRIVRL